MTDRDPERDEARGEEALDARLRAAFAPPADVGERARAAVAAACESSTLRPTRPWRRVAAAAAVLAVAAGLWWWAERPPRQDAPPGVAGGRDSVIDSVYADITRRVGRGDVAAGTCQSPQGLAGLFDERYGSPLYVQIRPELPVLGPFPYEALPEATVLCGMTGDGAIPIVVGASEDGPLDGIESSGALRCYRRELDDLVIYELSPLDAPACLELFSTVPE